VSKRTSERSKGASSCPARCRDQND
jgi:hypothetical protein